MSELFPYPIFEYPPDFVERLLRTFPEHDFGNILGEYDKKEISEAVNDRFKLRKFLTSALGSGPPSYSEALRLATEDMDELLKRTARESEILALYREEYRIQDEWFDLLHKSDQAIQYERDRPRREYDEWYKEFKKNEKPKRLK